MSRVHEPTTWWPSKYPEALRLLFDPERMQLAGFLNNRPRNIIYDYSKGGVISRSLLPLRKNSDLGLSSAYSSELFHIINGQTATIISDAAMTTAWRQMANNVVTSVPLSGNGKILHIRFKQKVNSEYYSVDRIAVRFVDNNNSYIDNTTYTIDGWNGSSYYGYFKNAWNKPNDGDLFDFYIKEIPESARWVSLSIGHDYNEDTNHEKYYIYDLEIEEVFNGLHGITKGDLEQTGWWPHPAAIQLDGVNDYGDFGNICNVGTNSFILFAWVKTDQPASSVNMNIFDKRDGAVSGGGKGYSMTVTSTAQGGGYLGFGIGDGTNFIKTYTNFSNAKINNGEWHCVAIVSNRNNAIGFVDNVEHITMDISSIGDTTNDGLFTIGRSSYNATEFYTGLIGISGIYIFDGQSGAPSSIPADYTDIIADIWNGTKSKYGL